MVTATSYIRRLRGGRLPISRDGEQGDIVQTVLIIALFVVIIVAVFSNLTPAVASQGKHIADCVANAHKGFSSCNF